LIVNNIIALPIAQFDNKYSFRHMKNKTLVQKKSGTNKTTPTE
jgi:hypothetical protein